MLNPDGLVNTLDFDRYVTFPLTQTSINGLHTDHPWKVYRDVFHQTSDLTINGVRNKICDLLNKLPFDHALFNNSRTTYKHHERGQEWTFFQNRREKIPLDLFDCEKFHQGICNRIKRDLVNDIFRQSNVKALDPDSCNIFMRCKTPESIYRKMCRRKLDVWEVGDLLGFFICPPSLAQLPAYASALETSFGRNILHKQNGFLNSLLSRKKLDRAVSRRFFYIIRYDDKICIEIQLITFRQLLYILLSHPHYTGALTYGIKDHKALYSFGDRSFLLDLHELSRFTENQLDRHYEYFH